MYKIAGQHSFNYPPSFLFRYLERLVRRTPTKELNNYDCHCPFWLQVFNTFFPIPFSLIVSTPSSIFPSVRMFFLSMIFDPFQLSAEGINWEGSRIMGRENGRPSPIIFPLQEVLYIFAGKSDGETINVRIPTPGNRFTLSEVWTTNSHDATWRDKVVQRGCPVDESTTITQHVETGNLGCSIYQQFLFYMDVKRILLPFFCQFQLLPISIGLSNSQNRSLLELIFAILSFNWFS